MNFISNEKDTFSTIGEEIRLLESYLDIEKIRFGKRLKWVITGICLP